MNKLIFFTGLAMFSSEVIGIVLFLLKDYFTLDNLSIAIAVACFLMFNIVGLALIVAGIIKE